MRASRVTALPLRGVGNSLPLEGEGQGEGETPQTPGHLSAHDAFSLTPALSRWERERGRALGGTSKSEHSTSNIEGSVERRSVAQIGNLLCRRLA
ncbi:MAG: hypothetical protein RMK20_07045, partial [Verrucomicrobiales bacterium]|nr:hypothetical protein [Verrucomicrobiales bacterium]